MASSLEPEQGELLRRHAEEQGTSGKPAKDYNAVGNPIAEKEFDDRLLDRTIVY
jgi:hypothetical protein